MHRDTILGVVTPWHEETCARRRAHESTVEISTSAGTVRVSFQHRYGKLPLDREAGLRAAVNDDFDRYFKRSVSLKVKKEVAEDPTRLEQMVLALAESIGAANLSVQRIGERKSLPVTVIENALHRRATANSCNRRPAEDRRACRRIAATLLISVTYVADRRTGRLGLARIRCTPQHK